MAYLGCNQVISRRPHGVHPTCTREELHTCTRAPELQWRTKCTRDELHQCSPLHHGTSVQSCSRDAPAMHLVCTCSFLSNALQWI